MSNKIDKTFTKKDLLEIIYAYELDIEDAKTSPKSEIQLDLLAYLKYHEIIWNSEFPEISCSDDLISYLESPKPNNELNYKDKQLLIHRAKKLLHYCRGSYSIAFTDYKSIDEIYEEGLYIATYCDVPTCRRAILELNDDVKIRNKISMKISPKVKQQLEDKKINKDEITPQFHIEKGLFQVVFD
tara:strand:- start:1244 stop:1798 length:555 start_codon:yes stop_codon:yes gene_type:complete